MWKGRRKGTERRGGAGGYGRFMRRLALLASGTVAGQLILLAASPLLTRLYTPEAFGLFGIYTGLLAMLGIIVTGRFEFALPLPRSTRVAGHLALLALCVAAGLLLGLAVLLAVVGEPLARSVGLDTAPLLLWMLLPGGMFVACAQILDYWSLRRGRVGENAAAFLVRSMGQSGSQLVLFPLQSWGLALGGVCGEAARCLFFLVREGADALPRPGRVRLRWLWWLARRYRKFPLFNASAGLLVSGSRMLPVVVLAALYGPEVAGMFALTQRVVGMPTQMFGRATSRIVLLEMTVLGRSQRSAFLSGIVPRLSLLIGLPLLPVLLFGPDLFALIFGEVWRPAGDMARLLTPFVIVRFVTLSVSQSLNFTNQQEWHLAAGGASLLGMAATFALAAGRGAAPMTAIAWYAIAVTAVQIVFLVVILSAARRDGLRSLASRAASTPGSSGAG